MLLHYLGLLSKLRRRAICAEEKTLPCSPVPEGYLVKEINRKSWCIDRRMGAGERSTEGAYWLMLNDQVGAALQRFVNRQLGYTNGAHIDKADHRGDICHRFSSVFNFLSNGGITESVHERSCTARDPPSK